MVHSVLVLGGGSAGFLAAITLKTRLPQLPVTVLRSKEFGIIGVGEGTTVFFPNFLHGYAKIDPGEFVRHAHPTFKLGIKFLWGPRPHFYYTFSRQFDMRYVALPKETGYYCDRDADDICVNAALMAHDRAFERSEQGFPVNRNDVAYHVENAHFVAFLESQATRLGVQIEDDTVTMVKRRSEDGGVDALLCASGRSFHADLFVDCSGFRSVLLGETLQEPFTSFSPSLFCDRAVVGGWARQPGEVIKPYTTAETMDHGWCWRIDHEHRINRGYVYSSAFVSDDDAREEFTRKHPRVRDTRVVKYVSGCYRRGWVHNVVAIGNSFGFVEPLESTSLAAICDQCKSLANSLVDSLLDPGPGMALAYNIRQAKQWADIRAFLAVHYKFNTRLDTPFWHACRNDTDLADAAPFAEYYLDNGPSTLWREELIGGHDVFGFEGYLALMVGMNVPYKRRYHPTDHEIATWRTIQQSNRQKGANGHTVQQTLDLVRNPNWKFKEGFYKMD